MGLIRQTGFVFAYIPESSPGRSDASGIQKKVRRKSTVLASHSRYECSTISALNRSYIHGGHSSEWGWGGKALIVASVGKSSGNAVETQSNIGTAQRSAQRGPEPARSTGNNRRMAHRVQSCLESSAGVMPMVRFLHPPPIINFYPRFDKTRRTGSAMTAPSDLIPVCDGAQVSPGGRIGSGGKHDGGKDRTIPHQPPP